MPTVSLKTTLETPRLRLRPVSHDDIELVWSASRKPGFNDGMVWDPPRDRVELVAITDRNLAAWAAGSSYTFTIDLAADHTAIGRVAIRTGEGASVWDIGFWIHPEYWNKGYATEAARAVIDFGFGQLGASRITTAHAIFNTPSQRVIEKLGFRFTGENPCGFEKQGKPVAEYEYVLEA